MNSGDGRAGRNRELRQWLHRRRLWCPLDQLRRGSNCLHRRTAPESMATRQGQPFRFVDPSCWSSWCKSGARLLCKNGWELIIWKCVKMALLLVKTSDNQIFILENVTDSCTSSADRSTDAFSNGLIRLPWIVDSDLAIFTNCRAKRSARAPREAEDLICVTLKALVLLQSVQVPNLDSHVVAGGQQNVLGQRMKSYEVNLL